MSEEKLHQDVAKRLSDVVGRPVNISALQDKDGKTHHLFEFKAGKDKKEAEIVSDRIHNEYKKFIVKGMELPLMVPDSSGKVIFPDTELFQRKLDGSLVAKDSINNLETPEVKQAVIRAVNNVTPDSDIAANAQGGITSALRSVGANIKIGTTTAAVAGVAVVKQTAKLAIGAQASDGSDDNRSPNFITDNKYGMLAGFGGLLAMMLMGFDPLIAIIGGLLMSVAGSAADGGGLLNGMLGKKEENNGPDKSKEKEVAAQAAQKAKEEGKNAPDAKTLDEAKKAVGSEKGYIGGAVDMIGNAVEQGKGFISSQITPSVKPADQSQGNPREM